MWMKYGISASFPYKIIIEIQNIRGKDKAFSKKFFHSPEYSFYKSFCRLTLLLQELFSLL